MDSKVSEMSTGGAAIGFMIVIIIALFAFTALQKAFNKPPAVPQ